MHPINVKWQFSINDTYLRTVVTPTMRSTLEQVTKFLEKCQENSVQVSTLNFINLMDLLDCTIKEKSNEIPTLVKQTAGGDQVKSNNIIDSTG